MLRGPLICLCIFAFGWLFLSFFWAYGSFDQAAGRIVHSDLLSRSNLYDVQNQTLGFQRIFVASLPSRSDKRDEMVIAASFTGITIDWVDGVDGATIPAKAIPNVRSRPLRNTSNNTLGCWRVHMNIAQQIVRDNIASALVMEDDADWDVNLKGQLVEFARGTRYLLDQETKSPHSPYGDGWDGLWLGHCGLRNREQEDQRYWVIRDDPTAVPRGYLWGNPPRQPNLSPPVLNGTFNRVVYRPTRGLCMAGYAISLAGARRLLRDQQEVRAVPSDRALNRLCTHAGGMCLAPYPTLIGSYKGPGPATKGSDRVQLSTQEDRKVGRTGEIVFSMRLNFWQMIDKEKKLPIKSQWPAMTMLPEINGTVEIPRGEGVFVKKEEYLPFPRPD
ncbi:glycosyltransferase family 25 protein [Pleomassaria siparia CBS 279.74]|uniref:Glycosyltransferase family 25 protein n=1 Tax=Pleomassaria siparia CBS 279.74 TaxID=1314801 RepID=A0A6G1JZE3_9PLEO|nr:glycosyltransferase family 25 protein [Pleomassaria siparia CBS 279.74]